MTLVSWWNVSFKVPPFSTTAVNFNCSSDEKDRGWQWFVDMTLNPPNHWKAQNPLSVPMASPMRCWFAFTIFHLLYFYDQSTPMLHLKYLLHLLKSLPCGCSSINPTLQSFLSLLHIISPFTFVFSLPHWASPFPSAIYFICNFNKHAYVPRHPNNLWR